MRNVKINGIDGPVIMNSNGDRLDEYSIMRLEEGREEYSPVLAYTAHHRQLREVEGQKMRWPGNCSNPVYRQVVCTVYSVQWCVQAGGGEEAGRGEVRSQHLLHGSPGLPSLWSSRGTLPV